MRKNKFCSVKLHAVFFPVIAVLIFSTVVGFSVLKSESEPFPNLYVDEANKTSTALCEKNAYLTFDDGPSEITEKILELLEKEGIRATFFVIGPEGEKTDERIQKIAEKGHKIGLHSYSHDYKKIYSSVENYLADINEERDWLYDLLGEKIDILRFPGGKNNSIAKKDVMAETVSEIERRGFSVYDWNCDGEDSIHEYISAWQIAENVLKNIDGEHGAIILLHDSSRHENTLSSLEIIIERLKGMGYDFSVLP